MQTERKTSVAEKILQSGIRTFCHDLFRLDFFQTERSKIQFTFSARQEKQCSRSSNGFVHAKNQALHSPSGIAVDTAVCEASVRRVDQTERKGDRLTCSVVSGKRQTIIFSRRQLSDRSHKLRTPALYSKAQSFSVTSPYHLRLNGRFDKMSKIFPPAIGQDSAEGTRSADLERFAGRGKIGSQESVTLSIGFLQTDAADIDFSVPANLKHESDGRIRFLIKTECLCPLSPFRRMRNRHGFPDFVRFPGTQTDLYQTIGPVADHGGQTVLAVFLQFRQRRKILRIGSGDRNFQIISGRILDNFCFSKCL